MPTGRCEICHTVGMAVISVLMIVLTALLTGCSAAQPTQIPAATPAATSEAPRLQSLRLERVLVAYDLQAPTNTIFGTNGEVLEIWPESGLSRRAFIIGVNKRSEG